MKISSTPPSCPPGQPPAPPAKPPFEEPPVNEARLVDTFVKMVTTRGESRNERAVADTIKAELATMGLTAEEDDAGRKIGGNTGNLIVKVPGNTEGAPTLLFGAHMDTVPLAVGVKPVIQDGVIRSDGKTALGGDNRAGVSEILEAVRSIKEHNLPHGDIELLFSVGEELGLLGARALDSSKINPTYAFAVDVFKPNQVYVQGRGLFALPDREPTAEDVRRFKEEGPEAPLIPPDGIELSPKQREILDFTAKAMKDVGLTPEFRRIEYAGTDAVALRRKGFNAISLGAGENRPHTVKEQVEIKDLVDATRLVRRLIVNAALAAVPGPAGLATAVAAGRL